MDYNPLFIRKVVCLYSGFPERARSIMGDVGPCRYKNLGKID